MKKLVALLLALVMALSLTACGKKYTCSECGTKTNKAYYDMSGDLDYVLCEDCARSYWMPLDYTQYRVK